MRLEGRGCRDMIPSGAVLFFFFFFGLFIPVRFFSTWLLVCVLFSGVKLGLIFMLRFLDTICCEEAERQRL